MARGLSNSTSRDSSHANQLAEVSGGQGLKRAILIGVSDYENAESWPPLTGAERDIEAWSEQLTTFGFDVERLVTRVETTRTSILHKVRDKCFQMPPQGSLIIVFAGHGVTVARQQWLVPSDAPRLPTGRNAPSLISNFEDYLLPADFRGAISETEAEHTLLVIDACRTELRPSDRREASPFNAAPSRADQRVILVYAATPGASAFEVGGEGGILSGAMVETIKGLGNQATLSKIFDETNKRIRNKLEEHNIDNPSAGLRVQCEWGPNFDIWETKFFAPAPSARERVVPKSNRRNASSRTIDSPRFDIDAFHAAGGRDRRVRAYVFLREWYKLALDVVAGLGGVPSEYVPKKHDERVYEDDDDFLDFNFWSSTSPLNKIVEGNDCLWYFMSLGTREFRSKEAPSLEDIEIHLGAVFSEYGLRRLVRQVRSDSSKLSVTQISKELRKAHDDWTDVRENDFGNLQIGIAIFTLGDLAHDGKAKFFAAFAEMLRVTEPRIMAAAS